MLLAAALHATAGAQAVESHPYEPGIDVLHYDLALDLPDSGTVIEGRAVLTVRRTAPRDNLRLDLVHLHVDSVLVDGRAVRFVRSERSIGVPLPTGSGGTFRITVVYGGAPENGLIIGTDSAGRWTGFGDNWPNRARYWIPSVDDPSDKATVTWTVHAPANRTVVANGTLVERRRLAADAHGVMRSVTRWRESRPIATYLMVIAAAPLSEYDLGETACGLAALARCVPQMVYVAPEQRSVLPGAFARAGAIVRYFAEEIAPFPYEKLAHLQSSTKFGGMENASEIFYADDIVRHGRMTDGLIAHETAHQWFGDAVTEREWGHLWLSEGFATYFAALWARHARGDTAFRRELAAMRATVLTDRRSVPTRPVIDTTQLDLPELLDVNSYQKGGFVLHMLHALLGEDAFFAGLREYYYAHRDGNAVTDDLQHALEHASGLKLGWFFDQWLRRPGYPSLDVSWRYDPATRHVVVEVRQQPRFGDFRFPLTLEVREPDGRVHRATMEVPAVPTTTMTLPMRLMSAPTALTPDPDVDLLADIRVHAP